MGSVPSNIRLAQVVPLTDYERNRSIHCLNLLLTYLGALNFRSRLYLHRQIGATSCYSLDSTTRLVPSPPELQTSQLLYSCPFSSILRSDPPTQLIHRQLCMPDSLRRSLVPLPNKYSTAVEKGCFSKRLADE